MQRILIFFLYEVILTYCIQHSLIHFSTYFRDMEMIMSLISSPFFSILGFVLRIWCHEKPELPDKIILTWGIYLSGLVYLGTKLSDIQPTSFKPNSVIFQLNGGYYTSSNSITQTSPKPLLFIDSLNVLSDENKTSIVRYASVRCAKSEVRTSYNVKKLQRLQSLQQSIKNKALDATAVRERINVKMGMDESPTNVSPLRESPEPSTSSSTDNFMALPSLSRIMTKKVSIYIT